ncbi:hypothetical protein SSX86_032569 [Deinandra increscens subsp. villosa]|uniref:RRM domain-containing protein n=1 Tax=Deinandra increscens subsp. villosa TaxID=3103831 RepID=A0AAP0C6U8_9ASTR
MRGGLFHVEEEEGWKLIQRKRKGGVQEERRQDGRLPGITSFYVTNLPWGCTKERLEEECRRFGRVEDVFIPFKRNKFGGAFGFVKFSGVRNVQTLERVLNKVKINGAVLKVNVEKFDRCGAPAIGFQKGQEKKVNVFERNPHLIPKVGAPVPSGNMWKAKGVSFASILTGEEKSTKEQAIPAKQKEVEKTNIKKVTVKKTEFMIPAKWRGKSLLGRAASLQKLEEIQNKIERECFSDCTTHFLGGLQLLLSFPEEVGAEHFKRVMAEEKVWFSKLIPWNGEKVKYERMVWLKISGVPIQLWDEEIFIDIGKTFGEVVYSGDFDTEETNLAWKNIGVVAQGNDRIDEEIELIWEESPIRCRVTEVEGEWLPEFLHSRKAPENHNMEPVIPSQVFMVQPPEEENEMPENTGSDMMMSPEKQCPVEEESASSGNKFNDDVVSVAETALESGEKEDDVGFSHNKFMQMAARVVEERGPHLCSRRNLEQAFGESEAENGPVDLEKGPIRPKRRKTFHIPDLNFPAHTKPNEDPKTKQGRKSRRRNLYQSQRTAVEENPDLALPFRWENPDIFQIPNNQSVEEQTSYNTQERADIALVDEVLETIRMAAVLGVQLEGREEEVSKVVLEERSVC